MSEPRSYVDLEGPICDLAMAARLVQERLVEAEAGPRLTVILPQEIHWGLLQVINRTQALYDEFYAITKNGREAAQ